MHKPIDQTVLMVGQSSDTVTYNRQDKLLNNLMGFSNKAKEALTEKKDFLQKHDGNVVGKKFKNHIAEVTKRRKTTIGTFSAGKSKSGSSQKEPFPDASQRKHEQRGRVAGVRFSSPEAPTIKTTDKDGSNKTPIRIEEDDINIQA